MNSKVVYGDVYEVHIGRFDLITSNSGTFVRPFILVRVSKDTSVTVEDNNEDNNRILQYLHRLSLGSIAYLGMISLL